MPVGGVVFCPVGDFLCRAAPDCWRRVMTSASRLRLMTSAVRFPGLEGSRIVKWFPASAEARGEGCLRGGCRDDVVVGASVDVERDTALVVIEGTRVDDALQHRPVGVCHLPVEHIQAAGLRVTAIPQSTPDGSEVFRAAVRAREHYHRPNPAQLLCPALVNHPGQEALQNETSLAVGDNHYVPRVGLVTVLNYWFGCWEFIAARWSWRAA